MLPMPLRLVCLFLGLSPSTLRAETPIPADWVITGAKLIDGTGAPAREANIAIKGDRIVAVGQFTADPTARTLDATGLILAPGFIDLHTHSDRSILADKTRSNLNYLAQGVTTIVTGNCGGGPTDVKDFLATGRPPGRGLERHPSRAPWRGPRQLLSAAPTVKPPQTNSVAWKHSSIKAWKQAPGACPPA